MKFCKLFFSCLLLLGFVACKNKTGLFEKISSSRSNITFNNKITENDSINPLDVVNLYNGGGVGIGDFNNDGLQDIFFTGNMVPCKLYLNKGNFKFEDITDMAGVGGLGRWARGASIIDINNDGLMDIYVCNTISKDSLKRRNILYVNQGLDKDGIPHFKDMAAEYGLDIHVQSTMASFFDYDNDGDLDMYLTVNEASNGNDPVVFLHRSGGGHTQSVGRLYRNEMDPQLKHPVFHDVSQQAGIIYDGFGHAASICDINNDGWKDIYVSDDFISNNILYINNHDGTFSNKTKEYFKHTSLNSMGQDVADINNDGLPDIIELDMNPPDNLRKKTMLATSNYITYQNFDNYGYQYQYVRNILELNQGPRVENDTIGAPVFSDIGFMSGIAQTDWSWAPMVADFDNDGYRDIIITNGFPKDVSDHDFISYRKNATGLTSKAEILKQIPEVKLHNYAFHNNRDLTFSDQSINWGMGQPTFSNGAAYADFDNDGALDMAINNINDEALVYRNTTRDKDSANSHFLQVKFKGDKQNVNGVGASVTIYYGGGKLQTFENNPYRGYISSVQGIAHFGLGNIALVDSVVVKWNNEKKQTIKNVTTNQVLTVNFADANETNLIQQDLIDSGALFREVTKSLGFSYRHRDPDFIDFNIQSILPHKFTEFCPALAAADIDGDGVDDLVVGGNSLNPAEVFLSQKNGTFIQKDIYPAEDAPHNYKDEGLLLFDANGDGKPDLYIARGGFQYESGNPNYQDRLYINVGDGKFALDTTALPQNHVSKLCVRAFDFNKDGKPDLFVSGRVEPGKYPKPVSSFILRNDSKDGKVKFTDVTDEVAPALKKIGMVCDALFTDFDNDGQTDLILTGEWMPVTFLKNINGKFTDVTASSGINDKVGLWNSIVAGDFRHTGKTDYIIGNVGLNTIYQPNDQDPIYITAGDFADNGGYEVIPSLFLPDQDGQLKEFPTNSRDEIIERLPGLKKRFPNYRSFALATMDEIIPADKRKGSIRLKSNMLQSCYLRNDGGGKFTMIPLPKLAQVSTVNGMIADDFDGDGNLDVLINGNDFGTDVSIGRYDGFNGLLLKGDGNGGFTPVSISKSGIYIPGNGKALISFTGSNGNYLVAASQNKDALKLFELNRKVKTIKINPDDVSAMIHFKNGKIQKEEFYYGSSFLSQSARSLDIDENVSDVEITDSAGKTRKIPVN